MADPGKKTPKKDPNIMHLSPGRPKTLIQKISSAFGKPPAWRRPASAPNFDRRDSSGLSIRRTPTQEEQAQLLNPQPSGQPPPSDPDTYYSFPRLEEPCCDSLHCGLLCRRRRSIRTVTPTNGSGWASALRCNLSRACTPSRAGLPCGHCGDRREAERPPGRMGHREGSPPMNARPVRVVVDNRPQRAAMPRNLPPHNALLPRGGSPAGRPRTRHGPILRTSRNATFNHPRESVSSPTSPTFDARGTPSPRIHHILCQEDRLYMHQQEARQYMTTVQVTGAHSPDLTASVDQALARGRQSGSAHLAGRDFSETVFYHGASPITTSPSTLTQQPSRPSRLPNPFSTLRSMRAGESGAANSNGRLSPLDQEIQSTNVYRNHGPRGSWRINDTTRHNINEGGSSATTHTTTDSSARTPSTVGGKRLELRGGYPGMARLRGGAGSSGTFASFGLKLKAKLRTCLCHLDCHPDPLVPSNSPAPRRVTVPPGYSSYGVARLPRSLPNLRGGGGEGWDDEDRLPRGLYYLAGGRGPPITVKAWKMQKPRKRMGGFLGKVLYGHKAGTKYESMTKQNKSEDATKEKEDDQKVHGSGDDAAKEEGEPKGEGAIGGDVAVDKASPKNERDSTGKGKAAEVDNSVEGKVGEREMPTEKPEDTAEQSAGKEKASDSPKMDTTTSYEPLNDTTTKDKAAPNPDVDSPADKNEAQTDKNVEPEVTKAPNDGTKDENAAPASDDTSNVVQNPSVAQDTPHASDANAKPAADEPTSDPAQVQTSAPDSTPNADPDTNTDADVDSNKRHDANAQPINNSANNPHPAPTPDHRSKQPEDEQPDAADDVKRDAGVVDGENATRASSPGGWFESAEGRPAMGGGEVKDKEVKDYIEAKRRAIMVGANDLGLLD